MTDSAAFLVNFGTSGDQLSPSVAALASGGFAVAWTSGQSANSDIRARLFSGLGQAAGQDIAVGGTDARAQTGPEIMALAGGQLALTWQDRTAIGMPTLRMAILDADGSATTGILPVGTNGADLNASASLVGLSDGTAGIAFLEVDNGTQLGTGISWQTRDAGGQVSLPSTGVNQLGGASYSTEAAQLADGNVVVAWRVYDMANGPYSTHARIVTAAGAPLGDEFVLHGASTEDRHDFQIAALPGGGFVVVWSQPGFVDGSGEVYGRVWNGDGTPQSATFRVNGTTNGLQTAPQVTVLEDGRFCVAWAGGADADHADVFIRLFDAAGQSLGAEARVNTILSGNQFSPALATLADGRVIVTWEDMSGALGDPGPGIAGRILDFRLDAVAIVGTSAADSYVGSDFGDSLAGLAGNDSLLGAAGDDQIKGGDGNDILDGGQGDDLLSGGQGIDTVILEEGAVTADLRLRGGQATGQGTDRLSGIENLVTGDGADRVQGDGGSNILVTEGGDDSLRGGAGDDMLVGGAGRDLLSGGAGADGFAFTRESLADVDRITDFDAAAGDFIALLELTAGDVIYLGEAGFSGLGLAEARFASGKVVLDLDGDGAGDLRIRLAGVTLADQIGAESFLIL